MPAGTGYGRNDPDLEAALLQRVAQCGVARGLGLLTDNVKRDVFETFKRLVPVPGGFDSHVRQVKACANANQLPLQYCTARAGGFPAVPGCAGVPGRAAG